MTDLLQVPKVLSSSHKCLLEVTEIATAVRCQEEPVLPSCPAIPPHLCLDGGIAHGGIARGELTPDSC